MKVIRVFIIPLIILAVSCMGMTVGHRPAVREPIAGPFQALGGF